MHWKEAGQVLISADYVPPTVTVIDSNEIQVENAGLDQEESSRIDERQWN